MSFSVVVPTLGRPRYLEGCLAALAEVEPPSGRFEVVIVNDGGGAEIERVAKAAGELDVRVVAPPRGGPSAARNAGAAAAAGRYVAFTDDDCEPRRGWLRALERALEGDPGAAAGGVTLNGATDSTGAVASQVVVDALHAQFNRDAEAPRFFASQNLAVPKDEFAAAGGFDESFRYGEDREFCERWLQSGHGFVAAPSAIVDHMRTLSLSEFWRQHHGYGRGARAFARSRGASGRAEDTGGVLRGLIAEARRAGSDGRRVRLAGYVALSQVATTTGYLREAVRPISGT